MAANNSGDKGTRNLVIVMVSFIVVVGVVFSLISSRSSSTAAIPASVSAADGYGIVLNPSAKPTIDVYIDYQCPACKNFELINGGYLNEVIAQNKAKVVYHPMTFLGPESILAANAAACAAETLTRTRLCASPNKKASLRTPDTELISKPKLLIIALSSSDINNPPSLKSCTL